MAVFPLHDFLKRVWSFVAFDGTSGAILGNSLKRKSYGEEEEAAHV